MTTGLMLLMHELLRLGTLNSTAHSRPRHLLLMKHTQQKTGQCNMQPQPWPPRSSPGVSTGLHAGVPWLGRLSPDEIPPDAACGSQLWPSSVQWAPCHSTTVKC